MYRMTKDESLRAIQRHIDLKAFLRYENALRAAYAQSKDPHPARWLRTSDSRRLQGDRQLNAPR